MLRLRNTAGSDEGEEGDEEGEVLAMDDGRDEMIGGAAFTSIIGPDSEEILEGLVSEFGDRGIIALQRAALSGNIPEIRLD